MENVGDVITKLVEITLADAGKSVGGAEQGEVAEAPRGVLRGVMDPHRSNREMICFSTQPTLGYWTDVPTAIVSQAVGYGLMYHGDFVYREVELTIDVRDPVTQALLQALRGNTGGSGSCGGTCQCDHSTEADKSIFEGARAGEIANICAYENTPPNWVVINLTTDFTKCNNTFDNIKVVMNLGGYPAGTQVNCCTFSSVPPGWYVVGTSTDFTKCGRNSSFNNIKTIRKL